MASKTNGVKLGVFTLVIMNVTAVVSLKGLPEEAGYGLSSAFYYLLAAAVFLIPTSLVAAELAAMFQNKQGGMFRWVGEAFGKHFGLMAIWLQWTQSIFWYLTTLIFGGVAIAFIGHNMGFDTELSNNKYYIFAVVVAMFWIATFISMKGMGWTSFISNVGGLIGTVIPSVLLIVLAVMYLATGGESQMDFHTSFVPDLTNFNSFVLAVSIFSFYAGMEMSSIHITDMDNPDKSYPKAILISALITVVVFITGTFALGIIIPQKEISLTQSLLVGFDNYFNYIKASWLSPIIAGALAIGVFAAVLVWVSGPSRGIFIVGKAGYLPHFFQKANSNGVQKNILIVQAIIVTVLSLFFIVSSSINTLYQIFTQIAIILYQIMYVFMFAAAIILRYTMKDLERPFRIGKKGNFLIWVVGGLGFVGSILAFVLCFIPPSQLAIGSTSAWYTILVVPCVLFVVAPFVIYKFKKKSWTDPNQAIEPFHWETKKNLPKMFRDELADD